MVEDLPGLPQKEVIIERVFDHLLESPVDRGLPGVLQNLLLLSQTVKLSWILSIVNIIPELCVSLNNPRIQ